MSATGVIESSFDTKTFAVNTDQCTGSGRGLAVNPNQYPRYGRGRGNAGRGRGRSTTGRGQIVSDKLCTHCEGPITQ